MKRSNYLYLNLIALGLGLIVSSPALALNALEIKGVSVEFEADAFGACDTGDLLWIRGEGFGDQPSDMVVTLENDTLEVCGVDSGVIYARCPGGSCPEGDFRLSVKRKLRHNGPYLYKDEYDLTIGSVNPMFNLGLERVTTIVTNLAAGSKRVDTANCSAGKVPIGGGYDINPNTVDGEVIVMESGPYSDGLGAGWRIRADGSNTSVDWELVVDVYCINAPVNP